MLLSLILPLWHHECDETGSSEPDSCFWLHQHRVVLMLQRAVSSEGDVTDPSGDAPRKADPRLDLFGPLKHGYGAMFNIHFPLPPHFPKH